MRLTVDLPDEWSQVLRQAAVGAGYKSVSEYVRSLIENAPGVAAALAGQTLPPLHRSWGKSKVAEVQQDTEVTEHTEVQQVTPPPVSKAEPPRSNAARPMGMEAAIALAKQKASGAQKGLLPRNGKHGDSDEH